MECKISKLNRSLTFFIFTTFSLIFVTSHSASGFEINSNLIDSYIINGKEATSNTQFPYQVGLVNKTGANFADGAFDEQFCGGVAISSNWILSAAHCFDEVTDFGVIGGKIDLSAYRLADVKSPVELEVHPDYSSESELNDIALIKVSSLPSGVSPINSFGDSFKESAGTSVIVSGWGRNDLAPDFFPNHLQYANLTISSLSDCDIWANPILGATYSAASQVCAEGLADESDEQVNFISFFALWNPIAVIFSGYITQLDPEGVCFLDEDNCFLLDVYPDELPFVGDSEVSGWTALVWIDFFQEQIDFLASRIELLDTLFNLDEDPEEVFYATSCSGDSGGALANADGTNLVGIVSYGLFTCYGPAPGVYTRVSHFVPWINSIINPPAPPPQSNPSSGSSGSSAAPPIAPPPLPQVGNSAVSSISASSKTRLRLTRIESLANFKIKPSQRLRIGIKKSSKGKCEIINDRIVAKSAGECVVRVTKFTKTNKKIKRFVTINYT